MSLLSSRQDEEVMAEINITPFTDVLLVLLIIFMILAALVTPPGFEKALSKTSNQPQTQNKPKNNIEVMVQANGTIYVDGTKTNSTGIYGEMLRERFKRGERHVDVIADAKAPYGVIIRILDAAKLAGLTDVGFVTG